MPHFNCCKASCGRRIPSNIKIKRRTSEPRVWEAILEFGEDLPYDQPLCEICASKLKRQLASIQAARSQTEGNNELNEQDNAADQLEKDNVMQKDTVMQEDNLMQEDNVMQEDTVMQEDNVMQEDTVMQENNVMQEDSVMQEDVVRQEDTVREENICSKPKSRKAKPAQYYDVR